MALTADHIRGLQEMLRDLTLGRFTPAAAPPGAALLPPFLPGAWLAQVAALLAAFALAVFAVRVAAGA